MRKIAVQNFAGGNGKTTTVVSLGSALARKGKRVLILDLDPRGHIQESFNITHQYTMYDLLVEDMFIDECIVSARANLDCVISNFMLAAAETQLTSVVGRETILKLRMRPIDYSERYDFILIDCPPRYSILDQNALMYTDEIIIPIGMSYLAMLGATQVIDNLFMLKKYLKKDIFFTGIIPTFFEKITNMSKEVLEALKETYKEKVLPEVREDTRIKQAASAHQSILEFDSKSRAAEDYVKICAVLLNEVEQRLLN